jgi:hypothetical protein
MAWPGHKIPTSFHLWCGIATTIKYLPRELALWDSKNLPRGIAKRHPTGVISPGPQITPRFLFFQYKSAKSVKSVIPNTPNVFIRQSKKSAF